MLATHREYCGLDLSSHIEPVIASFIAQAIKHSLDKPDLSSEPMSRWKVKTDSPRTHMHSDIKNKICEAKDITY